MKRRREYVDYLEDIQNAIEKAEQFTEGMDFERFSSDYKTIYAVIRTLEIIGEASKKIPETVKGQNPGLPWREMAGIRDILIHEYFGVNFQVIWKTLKEDFPKLKPAISMLLLKIRQPGFEKQG
jgi:uncharacterized protein with HEPN domain